MKALWILLFIVVVVVTFVAGCAGTNVANVIATLEIWQRDIASPPPFAMIQRQTDQVLKFVDLEFRPLGAPDPVPVTLRSEKTGEVLSWPETGGRFSGIQALKTPWVVTSTKEDWTVTITRIVQPPGLAENLTQALVGSSWVTTTQVPVGNKVRWVDEAGNLVPIMEFVDGPGPQPSADGDAWLFSSANIGYWTAIADSGMETAFEVVAR